MAESVGKRGKPASKVKREGPTGGANGRRASSRTAAVPPEQVREPGIEPGPTPWQGAILPLDHSRSVLLAQESAPGGGRTRDPGLIRPMP